MIDLAFTRGVAAAFGVIVAMASANAIAAEPDKTGILAANSGFYAALNTLFTGDAGPMKAVWSHADDATYMGPTGGFEHGWAAILKDWEGQAAMKLGGRVEPVDMQVIAGQDLAIVSEYEQGENTNANGKVERVKLRATSIFRKEGGVWKMVAHHTDTLPYLAK